MKTAFWTLVAGVVSWTGVGHAEGQSAPDGSRAGEFTLTAEMQPMAASKYKLYATEPSLEVLRSGAVATAVKEWKNESLRSILPPDSKAVGATFPVRVDAFLPFLQQIHAGARETVNHMITNPGAFGCVLERGESTLDVLYRVHAGFELAAKRAWMAPAQFEGRLVLDRRSGEVRHFSLRLPPTRPNADLNVARGEGFIADIGSIPKMEVATSTPRAADAAGDEHDGDDENVQRARDSLQRAFYPFAAIDWLPMQEGLERAFDEDRPLHVVILFGALADESC